MTRAHFITFAFSATVSAAAFAAHADADAPPAAATPDIVISATRNPTPAREVASSITVIDREEIEQKRLPTVADYLREVPGVSVASNGGPGQTTRVFLRGADSDHTLVLVDGVAVNDPSDVGDAYDFAYLTPDNIERIEVLRGPQSTLYGSSAIGGVISITTRQGEGKPGVQGFAEGGSYDTYKAGIGSSGATDRFNYSVEGTRFRTGGFPTFDHFLGGQGSDPVADDTLSGRASAKLADNLSVNVAGRYTNGVANYDDFGANADNKTADHQWSGRASGDLALFDGVWKQELGVSDMRNLRNTINDGFVTEYDGSRQKADWVNNVKLAPNNTGTLGFELQRESFDGTGSPETSMDTRSAFAQDQLSFGDAFFATVGGRVDNFSTFGTTATYRVAPAYFIKDTGTKLKASYGTGFKAPSLFQLNAPIYGNARLQPEKSRGWDAGFEQSFWGDRLSFGSTYFRNDIRDLIDFDFATFRYLNVGRAQTHGLENFILLRPWTDTMLRADYTYLRTEDEATHSELLRRPQNTLNLTLDQRFLEGKGDAQFIVRSVSGREDIDFNFSPTIVKPYTTLNVNASYQLVPEARIYGRIDNLLDKRYEEIYGYGQPGLTFMVGVKGGL